MEATMNTRPINVLIIDDQHFAFATTKLILQKVEHQKYNIEWIDNSEEALDEMKRQKHDVFLVDYNLDSQTGLELIAKAHNEGVEVPAILLTGMREYEVDVEAMKSGAVDYLDKEDLNGRILERSIRYSIEQKKTEKELNSSQRNLERAYVFHKQQGEELQRQSEKHAELIDRLIVAKENAEKSQKQLKQEQMDLILARSDLQNKNSELEQVVKDLKEARTVLLQSEKLASVGQLAAGIAHEINTPIQFVGDNVRACSEMFEDLKDLFDEYRVLLGNVELSDAFQEVTKRIRKLEQDVDVEYIFDDIPKASSQNLDGIERVRVIVQAMKDFSHGGSTKLKAAYDVNSGLKNTLTVARNELKYVASVQTEYGILPSIQGYPGELNQVFLNILVNAAHALADKHANEKGVITVKTSVNDDWIVVEIRDNGSGIPEEIKNRIFDPFFTTKDVGTGTGQGLAISHSIIVDRHGGRIEVDSKDNVGTTFSVYLPLTAQVEDIFHEEEVSNIC